jgi:hypothetical protein
MSYKRQDSDPPLAVHDWGWRYHHLGIPTDKAFDGETHLEKFKLYVSGFETSPFGIEMMRYDEGSPVPEIIRKLPHIAFEVEDLDEALKKADFTVITPPNSPSGGVRVAMIEHNGAVIELIEFTR